MIQVVFADGWKFANGSNELWIRIILTLIVGFAAVLGMSRVPVQMRKYITSGFIFVAGLIYILQWLWPTAQDRSPQDIPVNFSERVAFGLEDAVTQAGNLANMIVPVLFFLGVFALVRMHATKVFKQQKDWGFSVLLLISLASITVFGYLNWWWLEHATPADIEKMTASTTNWNMAKLGKDFMFDGLLQQMDAAMFSLIAFYILSAAYRAFRIRSVESTILLSSALIVMLSLLGLFQTVWGGGIDAIGHGNKAAFVENLRLENVVGFIRQSFQVPGLRAIDFGIGVGTLAMGLRLWLGLEKAGN